MTSWLDRNGYQRNSSGGYVRAGTSFEFSRLLTGEIAVGWAARNYEDPRLQPLAGPADSASLVWTATPLTTAKFFATTSIAETTRARRLRRADAHLHRRSRSRFPPLADRRSANSPGARIDYQGDDRFDRFYSLSGDLIYKMNRNIWLKGTLRRDWLDSNLPGNSTASTVVMLGVRLQN